MALRAALRCTSRRRSTSLRYTRRRLGFGTSPGIGAVHHEALGIQAARQAGEVLGSGLEAHAVTLAQPPAIERDQPLPMPLGRRLVVAPALWEGEAMVDAEMHFELAGISRLVE